MAFCKSLSCWLLTGGEGRMRPVSCGCDIWVGYCDMLGSQLGPFKYPPCRPLPFPASLGDLNLYLMSFKYDFWDDSWSRGMRQGNRRKKVISYSIPSSIYHPPQKKRHFLFFNTACVIGQKMRSCGWWLPEASSWGNPCPAGLLLCSAELWGVGLKDPGQSEEFYLAPWQLWEILIDNRAASKQGAGRLADVRGPGRRRQVPKCQIWGALLVSDRFHSLLERKAALTWDRKMGFFNMGSKNA